MTNLEKDKMNELKQCASDYGVEMSFCIGFPKSKDMASPDPKVRQAGIDYSKRMIEAAEYYGRQNTLGHPVLLVALSL